MSKSTLRQLARMIAHDWAAADEDELPPSVESAMDALESAAPPQR